MDNIRLNDEQWAILKQARPHFDSVKKEYIRNCPRWLTEQIINVYESATGSVIHNKNLSCATCVLNIYKRISHLYEFNKKIREGEQYAESKCEIKESIEQSNDADKKKRSTRTAQKRVVKKKNNGPSEEQV